MGSTLGNRNWSGKEEFKRGGMGLSEEPTYVLLGKPAFGYLPLRRPAMTSRSSPENQDRDRGR